MPSVFNLGTQHGDVDGKIVVGLERLAQGLRVLLWDKAKAHGLSPIQVQFLVHLYYHPVKDHSVSHLAKAFDLTKATVSEAVTTLEQKGYLQRRPSSQDKRTARLELTKSGKALVSNLETWAETLKEPLAQLSMSSKLDVLEVLRQAIEALQQKGVITLARMCQTCRFLDNKQGFYCDFLNKPLQHTELRLDCPEHEAKSP